MSHAESLKVTAEGDCEIVITRRFAAPQQAVFEAMTRADLLQQWLAGPPGWSMVACESDLVVGGHFRHEWRGPGGEQLAMTGTYREIRVPDRLVRTETFEVGCESQGGEQVGTLTLESDGDRTTLRLVVLYPSQEARDAALQSGMDRGLDAGYRLLDQTLTQVSKP